MAFLTYADISSRVAGYNQQEVEDLLLIIETDLKKKGLYFVPEAVKTIIVRTKDKFPATVFDLPFMKAITEIKAKDSTTSDGITLTINEDYKVYKLVDHNIITGLKTLTYTLSESSFFEVTGTVGYMETVPDLLMIAIVKYIKSRLDLDATDGNQISSSKTAEVSTTYKINGSEKVATSIIKDKKFLSTLSYYIK